MRWEQFIAAPLVVISTASWGNVYFSTEQAQQAMFPGGKFTLVALTLTQEQRDALERQLTPVNRHLATKLVSASQSLIHSLIGQAEAVAAPLLADIVAEGRGRMEQTLGAELTRLQALKAVNPLVRDSEIEHLEQLQQDLSHLLNQTQLKLDAIRFVVVTHN